MQDSGVGALRDQRCLAPAGWLRLMMESTDALQRRIESSSSASGTTSTLTWDKVSLIRACVRSRVHGVDA